MMQKVIWLWTQLPGHWKCVKFWRKKKHFLKKKIFFWWKFIFWNFIGISLTVIDWKTINQQKIFVFGAKISSFLARKYLRFWRENIFIFGAKIFSILARKYLHFLRENIIIFGAKISSFLARKYLRRQRSESKNFFKTFFYSGNQTAWRHDIQHNDTQHNGIQHNDIQHNKK